MKNVLIKVLRTHPKKGNQFWQTFEYEGNRDVPISFVLDEINSREKIIDTNLDVATPILWDCDCREGKCGACAMLINHVPRLACTTILSNILVNGEAEIRPLTKFSIVADLKVDRTFIREGLEDMNKWLEGSSTAAELEEKAAKDALTCLACGCCLEACTNYSGDADFVGAMTANLAYVAFKQENDPQHIEGMKKKYKKKFFNGCSKSLMCGKVCPLGIPNVTNLSESKDMSVWRIWQKK